MTWHLGLGSGCLCDAPLSPTLCDVVCQGGVFLQSELKLQPQSPFLITVAHPGGNYSWSPATGQLEFGQLLVTAAGVCVCV